MKTTKFSIVRKSKAKCSAPMRVSPNLASKIKSIKKDVEVEFKKQHGISPKISDTLATKLLGMFLDGDNIVKVTHKRKSVNIRLTK